MTCSVLVLARNEEKNIQACLESCSHFADEIIVIDDFSTDKTLEIARNCGAKVIQRSLNGDWGAQQTFAINQATKDWLFFIDADERCTPELSAEITPIIKTKEYAAYWVKRLNFFNHKRVKHGMLSPDWVMRLLPREGTKVEGYVHQTMIFHAPEKKLKNSMFHYTYETWDQIERKMQKYSPLSARKYFDEGRKSNFIFDISIRPLFAFIKMYILKLGFLDGTIGLALSINYANYTLSKYFKLYELNSRQ